MEEAAGKALIWRNTQPGLGNHDSAFSRIKKSTKNDARHFWADWSIPGLFFFIFVFSIQFNEN